MKLSLRRDLGLQLLALYLMFVGPVVLALLGFDRIASQRLDADVKASDLALARAIAQETNTSMDGALQAVRQLATYPAVIQADPAGMQELFRTLMSARPDINLVYRLDPQGVMVYHYPAGPASTVGTDFSGRDYFQRALLTRNPLVSQGRISPTTQQPVASAVMPLWSDAGQFLGVVATNIKLQALSHTLASIAGEHLPEEGFQVMIIDSGGQVIAHPSPPALLQNMAQKLPQVTQAALSGEAGSLVRPDETGQERLFSYMAAPSAGWGVIVSQPTATAFATQRALHRGVLFTMGVFLVIGLFFWLALSQRVIRPLEQLSDYSRTIGVEAGPASLPRPSLADQAGRNDQIGDLVRSLERMEQAIDARLSELSTLLQTSAAVVSSLDSQVVLDRILEQVERLMGIRMGAIVSLDEPHGVFRASASRGLSKRYTDQMAIDPSEPFSVSMRALRSGGPVQISDTEQDKTAAALKPRAQAEGYRSLLAVPLKTQHAPPSALLVYRPDPHVFSQREINLLANFANQAAMAIENATLYARSDLRLREQTRRLEALIQSLQDGLILEDLQGCALYANRRIGELVDLSPEEISTISVSHLIERLLARSTETDPAKKEWTREAVEAARKGQGPRSLEFAIHSNRHRRYLRLQVFDVTDTDGMLIGRGQILRDVTRNREIDRMKSSLIATVSHELRTPLAAIKGYASTLLAEDVHWDSLSQREFLEIISGETDRLSELVNELLDMSRIEAGSLTVSRAACDLEKLIERANRRARPSPSGRLQVNLPPDLPPVYADPQRIEAVLRNLFENAAKYAGEASPVRVSAAAISGNLIVRVEDEGPGIPAEDSERVFEPFYRVENSPDSRAVGAGVGLAICQGFVRAHGGEIWLEPRSSGACIAFSLPLSPAPGEPRGPDLGQTNLPASQIPQSS